MYKCINCNSSHFKQVLKNRPDFEYGCVIKLDYFKCMKCGHISAYPIPSLNIISSFYTSYSTHSVYKPSFVSKFLDDILKYQKVKELKTIFKNDNLKNIKVLDYGSGNGNFLNLLSQLDIKKIYGFDFDSQAIECSRKEGFKCFTEFDEIKQNKYDYIFLNHVIEHLSNPKETMKNLIELLSENGKVILRTPNVDSLLAKVFKENWRGWETPRHLNIFNKNSVKMFDDLNYEYRVVNITTSNKMFIGIFTESLKHKVFNFKIIRKMTHFSSLLFFTLSYLINFINKNSGEELSFEISKIRKKKK